MNDKERIWGFLYLLAELFALPAALEAMNRLLPAPLPDAWLNFLYFALNFIFTCFLFRSFLRRCLTRIGKNTGDFLLVTAAGFGIYYLCNLVLNSLILLLAPDFANLNDSALMDILGDYPLLMLLSTVVLAPVAEELLYRGLVFGWLREKNAILAYILSALFFSGIHVLQYIGAYSAAHVLVALVLYLPAGLCFAWAYQHSGTILTPIIIHAVNNLLAFLVLR
jgi:membrane protease YdiL (CAAX protease family)